MFTFVKLKINDHVKLKSLLLILSLVNLNQIQCDGNGLKRGNSSLFQIHPLENTIDGGIEIVGEILNQDNNTNNKNGNNQQLFDETIAAGFLVSGRADTLLENNNELDLKLAEILQRDGPDMRPSRDYKDFKDISMNISKRAWQMYHKRIEHQLSVLFEQAWPIWEQLLKEAHVSNKCLNALEILKNDALNLKAWAIKLLNSWGHFPMNGLYEGTYGDVGAFHTCVDINNIPTIDHAHYCSVTFRPILPSRSDYDLIVRHEPWELREMFEQKQTANSSKSTVADRDALSDILKHAQYHHFVYYKWGTCWPIACSPFDVRRLTKLLARRNILMNGPVKCYSLNRTDYEQPDNETLVSEKFEINDHEQLKLNQLFQNKQTKFNLTLNRDTGKILEISIWDKNNGTFIWKPHFKSAQKISLIIILILVAFVSIMSLIDLLINRMPILWKNFKLSLEAKPLKNNRLVATTKAKITNNNSATIVQEEEKKKSISGGGGSNFPLVEYKGLHLNSTVAAASSKNINAQQNAAENDDDGDEIDENQEERKRRRRLSLFMEVVDDCSLFTNVPQFFRVSEGQLKNDILCLNGIRCITMAWIIMTHTMMYNDWSAFARTKEVEIALNSLISQPLFNGSYLVDTFFLMSGLLSAFTAFKHSQGLREKFNSFAFIFNRWLRLTPQIFIISLIYICFPALSYGPHWFPIVGEYSENCVKNWWINVLHMQAFYKKEEMCNFVTWWISIDFFYHFFALAVIWIILIGGHKFGFITMSTLVGSQILYQSIRHFSLELPPNVLSTIPQTGSMWTIMTLDFFWTPYTHSVPFFFGFYIGYLMALKQELIMENLNSRRALIGWILSIGLLLGQSYATYWWVTGKASYSPLISTLYYGACSLVWASSLCWIIIACHHGYGGFINQLLSCKLFIILGKASYLVYLSHFQVLFIFFGNQNLLLEPTTLVMVYMIFGNIFISTLWGIFLCSIFELPWLKAHRRLIKYV